MSLETWATIDAATPEKEIWRKKTDGNNYTIIYKDGSSLKHTVNQGLNTVTSDTIRDVITNRDGTQKITETISTGTGGVFGRTDPSLPQKVTTTYPDGSKKITVYRYGATDYQSVFQGGNGNPRVQIAETKQYDKDGSLMGSEVVNSYKVDLRSGAQKPDELARYLPNTREVYDANGNLIEKYDAHGSTNYTEKETYTYDETGKVISTKTYDNSGKLVSNEVASEMTFGGKVYTFDASKLRSIINSLDSMKESLNSEIANIASRCNSMASAIASEDSGISSALNKTNEICKTCKSQVDSFITGLCSNINSYISKTISNEEQQQSSLDNINMSLDKISSTFDGIGR